MPELDQVQDAGRGSMLRQCKIGSGSKVGESFRENMVDEPSSYHCQLSLPVIGIGHLSSVRRETAERAWIQITFNILRE